MLSGEEIQFINSCLICVPIALFIYDWLITLGDEVDLVWRRRWKWKSDLPIFVALRYGTVGLTILTFRHFEPGLPKTVRTRRRPACARQLNVLSQAHHIQTLAGIVGMLFIFLIAQVLMQIRVYVMYGRSRKMLWTNIVLFALEIVAILTLVWHFYPLVKPLPVSPTQPCRTCSLYPKEYSLAYVAPLVYETYLLVLAARKSVIQRNQLGPIGGESILDVLVRGSIHYFLLVSSGLLISMISFIVAPRFVDWLDLLSDVTSSIGGTRLILSMREALFRPVPATEVSTMFGVNGEASTRLPWNHRRSGEATTTLELRGEGMLPPRTLGVVPLPSTIRLPALHPKTTRAADPAHAATPSPPTSPAQTCPQELLGEILICLRDEEAASDPTSIPTLLARASLACKSWHAAVTTTPRLWQRVVYNVRHMQNQLCWLSYLSSFVEHAGIIAFNVHIISNMVSVDEDDECWTYFSTHILARAQRLTVDIDFDDADSYFLVEPWMPRLEVLTVRSTSGQEPALSLDLNAPKLHTISITNVDPDLPDPLSSACLMLSTLHFQFDEADVEFLADVVRDCPCLRELRLGADYLSCVGSTSYLLPRLQCLYLSIREINAEELNGRLILPDLQSLAVHDDEGVWAFWRAFIDTGCQKLTSLTVIRNSSRNIKEFLNAMGGLTQIEQLLMHAGSLNSRLFARLAWPTSSGTLPFPNLRQLRFEDTVPHRTFTPTAVSTLLNCRNDALRSRSAAASFVIQCDTRRDASSSTTEIAERLEAERTIHELNNRARFSRV
ncbi:hypothetical protein AURDEDRAFT_164211 [Auricularia subglabra TFB-10046 SS5]|nr:hypothetical protein AURDEDRAFT_164211 [Auricularia subglabra TFB-10046 SS5]